MQPQNCIPSGSQNTSPEKCTSIQFFRLHLSQQQDSTEAMIHWEVVAEKRLFRAAFCSQWTGTTQGIAAAGNAQLPSTMLPEMMSLPQSFYWNYRTSKETEACFFKLSFAEARLHRRDALTGNTLCLSRQPIFHGAHLHAIYYWTLLEHKAISLCNENSSYKGIYASVMGFFPQHFYISLPASPFHTSCSRTTRWPWCLQCWMW